MNFDFSVEEAEAACKEFALRTENLCSIQLNTKNCSDLIIAAPYLGESSFVSAITSCTSGATYEEKVATPHNCPNCGAFLKKNDKKCEYCLTEFW